MRRRQKSREFWEQAVARARGVGRTRAAVARELGVSVAALSYWVSKLKREGARPVAGQGKLARVRVVTPSPAAQRSLELDVGGVVVRFEAGTSPRYLAELTGALRQC